MKYFVASDYHFYHTNIIKYTERPYSTVEEMNEDLITKWNEVVTNEDIVYYLGDFAFGKYRESEEISNIVFRLNGYKKFLVLGNHDDTQDKMYTFGWDGVFEQLIVNSKYGRILLNHYPIPNQNRNSYHFQNVICCVHGHVHQKSQNDDFNINASCEVTDFKPIELQNIISRWMKNGRK